MINSGEGGDGDGDGDRARHHRGAAAVIEPTDPRSTAAAGALARYYAELADRFGFDAPSGADDLAGFEPPDGTFLLVRDGARIVGCAGLRRLDQSTAEVKRMWIDPACRGQGLARRLLGALEDAARAAGRTRVVLDTHSALREAIALYERMGYRSVERYNDNPDAERWFAKQL